MWQVVACIMITNKGQVSPDIWPEIKNHGIGIEDMIITTWSKKALY